MTLTRLFENLLFLRTSETRLDIRRIHELPQDFAALMTEASQDGHLFLQKMKDEWTSGKNRFSLNAEALFGAFNDNKDLVAIGGVNIDPYLDDPDIGRVRHVYVSSNYRGRGLGKQILQKIETHSLSRFEILRLKTHNPKSVGFYISLGFHIDIQHADDVHHTYLQKTLF